MSFYLPFRPLDRSLLLAVALLLPAPLHLIADAPTEVYRWDAAHWLTTYNHTQFSATPITNADGTTGAEIKVNPREANNPYNQIIVTGANLKGGNEYTAIITFSVVEPTQYPTSFYMFARNTAGNQYDILRTWIGLPGPTRTIALPLELKQIDGGAWKLWMGVSKLGALRINSLVVYSGLTSDGKTSFLGTAPTLNATPLAKLPPGITEATGCTPFSVAPPANPVATLSAAAYKLTPDAPGAPAAVAVANAAALQQAINACKGHAARLIIPKGVYRVSAASNLIVQDLTDVTIDGQGSVFIFERLTKEGQAFFVGNCMRTVLENFTVDWDWNVVPIASLGTVSNLSPDKLQCDFTFPDLNAAQTNLTRTTRWRSIYSMDPVHLVTHEPGAYGGFAVPKEMVIAATGTGNILHVTFPKAVPFQNGVSYCIRHLYYDMTGFKVASSSDLTFNAVNIYSIPGMGWFYEGSMHDFQMTDCHIERAPGSRTPFTTAADGIHVDEFVDNLNLEKCSVTGTGDDAMNIHREAYQGEIVTDPADPTKLTLRNCPPYLLRLSPGDPVEIDNADYSYLNGSATPVTAQVASVSSTNKGHPETVIHFTNPVPAGVTAECILSNAKFTCKNARITGCDISYTNGRGILLSAQNVLITDCHLGHIHASAMNLESELVQPLWSEGRGDTNVLIRNNIFENDSLAGQGRYAGAIIYTNTRFPWGPTETTLYRQITFEGNRFVNCPGPALSLSNCSDIVVRGNQFETTEAIPDINSYAATIFVTHSSALALGGNKWINRVKSDSAYGVVYDPATTSDISTDTNALVNSF